MTVYLHAEDLPEGVLGELERTEIDRVAEPDRAKVLERLATGISAGAGQRPKPVGQIMREQSLQGRPYLAA